MGNKASALKQAIRDLDRLEREPEQWATVFRNFNKVVPLWIPVRHEAARRRGARGAREGRKRGGGGAVRRDKRAGCAWRSTVGT
jgi:hypothetical protein